MLFIFDMDGVIWRGTEAVPHAAQAVAALRDSGHTVRFLTNNAARRRADYIPRMASVGITASVEEVVTSAVAVGLYFQEQGWQGASVYVIGQSGVRDELTQAARCRLVETDAEPADVVVVGIDWEFTYEMMRVAQQHIMNGAHFVCTNRDPTFPVEGGRFVPGAGSIVSAVEVASGCEPFNIGKPNPYSVQLLSRLTGIPLSETVVIGDRLDTDIDCGIAAGVRTLLVMTGVTTQSEVDALPPEKRPTWTLPNLACLPAGWIKS
ncbi:MAG TPA: HAD-IIA family hydrolase [Armatimonadota bacterium]|jgi:HAD superfamily hydrolase (TIGR01457 family)